MHRDLCPLGFQERAQGEGTFGGSRAFSCRPFLCFSVLDRMLCPQNFFPEARYLPIPPKNGLFLPQNPFGPYIESG